MHHRRMLGNAGEQAVAEFLEAQGYEVLARNVRWRGGEVDIVARYRDTLAFVEVKTRRHDANFPLSTVITPGKQRKIITTACHWAAQNQLCNYVLRFDISLVILPYGKKPSISYIPNAFTAPDTHVSL